MGAINIRKMGLALGLTMVVLRIGCIILFSVVSHDQAVSFLRTLLCGVDVSPILLSEGMTVQDIIFSLIQVFVLGWLVGSLFASFYNLQTCCSKKEGGKKSECCH